MLLFIAVPLAQPWLGVAVGPAFQAGALSPLAPPVSVTTIRAASRTPGAKGPFQGVVPHIRAQARTKKTALRYRLMNAMTHSVDELDPAFTLAPVSRLRIVADP
jgi:hypothetical protein